jgi:hypothetical protein
MPAYRPRIVLLQSEIQQAIHQFLITGPMKDFKGTVSEQAQLLLNPRGEVYAIVDFEEAEGTSDDESAADDILDGDGAPLGRGDALGNRRR